MKHFFNFIDNTNASIIDFNVENHDNMKLNQKCENSMLGFNHIDITNQIDVTNTSMEPSSMRYFLNAPSKININLNSILEDDIPRCSDVSASNKVK